MIPVTERTGGESFPPFTARSRCSIKQSQTLLNNKARGYIKEFESIICRLETFWRCLNNGNVDPPSLRVPFPPSSCLSCLGELRTDRTTDRPTELSPITTQCRREDRGGGRAEHLLKCHITAPNLRPPPRARAAAAGMSSWMERERGESSPDGGGDRPPRHRSVGAVATAVAALTMC